MRFNSGKLKSLAAFIIGVLGIMLCGLGVLYIGISDFDIYTLRCIATILIGVALIIVSLRIALRNR